MNDAEMLTDHATDVGDQTNLVVVLRPSDGGLQVLLVADEKGRWSIPGGHAKDNESHAEAAVREVKEETSLDVEVQPLIRAEHAARKITSNVFYAVVPADTEGAKPGGGDVTEVRWAAVRDLGSLNGTDRLVIQVAANRIHNPQGIVDDAVELGESRGYAVGNVMAPPRTEAGAHIRLLGNAAALYASRLAEWTPTTVLGYKLCESSTDALERAHRNRHLTPMLESLLRVSDLLWHYENAIAPQLQAGRLVIELTPEFDSQPLLNRGMAPDLLENMLHRVPRPSLVYDVGDVFEATEFQMLKDAIEQMQNPDDPKSYLDKLTTRNMEVPWKMEFVRNDPNEPDNPIVRCPQCKHEGPLMNDFSLLAQGFNGVRKGAKDDLGAQECGQCAAIMEWDHIDALSQAANPELFSS